jgi:16S rRNA (uracil1498-N3)-methyltransferase
VIRLFVGDDLAAAARLNLGSDQAHYLTRVMRLAVDETLLLFNGRDGEWLARLSETDKRGCVLVVDTPVRSQATGADLDLIIALVKRARLETIVEKAAELGARRIRLVRTERTNADHTNVARLAAIATEASEQTGRLDVPQIVAPQPLSRLLADWEPGRRLMFCDEMGDADPASVALSAAGGDAWAILIGPEGGFSPNERERVRALPSATPVSLGPRILRADTAAIAAMTLWQSSLGDWRGLEVGDEARQVNINQEPRTQRDP